ncbi:regulatory protein, ArsR [Thermoproteus uzoniensis 768-20]|uniref:Regulatory protein, ArsR n=2 Tax=Thermoproteus TaxID=2270 RepID=F2L1M3_THEU7|nr:regulatory protein, ArsR [Thermoproteus uzoniensis 768-20]
MDMFNVTVVAVLLPLAVYPIHLYLPGNYTVYPHLPPFCAPNQPFQASGEAVITCVNPTNKTVEVRGYVAVQSQTPPPPPPLPPQSLPVAAIAAVAGAAAATQIGLNRREWALAALAPIIGRYKRATADDPLKRQIVEAVQRMGAATLSQIAKAVGRSWGAVQWHVYVLEREGKLKSVKVGPFTYYYVDRRAAADVILSSVDPSTLSLEDREKLDLMASS